MNWRNFSLEQINNKNGEDWKIWEQPDDFKTRGFWALRANEAARNQGKEAHDRFRLALLTATHVNRQPLSDRQTLIDAAREAGLDLDRFERDLADRSLIQRIADDHTEAVSKYGVFGTPTMIFPDGQAAFLKMRPTPSQEEAVAVFEDFIETATNRPYIHEIKRPTPP